jgi:hypothetical protein
MGNEFSSRMYKQQITDEFLDAALDNRDETEAVLEDAIKRFERSYAGVATFRRKSTSRYGGPVYEIVVVRTHDADPREIESGVQTILHWIHSEE